ncbi:NADH kinase pos5 [Spiromyces aspiralis]|uniref:NADH kinase pos5 n=1 Tax=Spiromyces aspiralis TaxID=68401 RepID=A0ACC1HS72_9FUNG|nr:NADH kinase pos5 [Spiromyces aspiralis]
MIMIMMTTAAVLEADGREVLHEYERTTDLIIALGGDGTVLHTSSLFRHQVPPIVCFSMGTLGFLLPFDIKAYPSVLSSLMDGSLTSILPRMRLHYTKHDSSQNLLLRGEHKIMNEICIHRGMYPHLTTLNCWVNNQLLTSSVADGWVARSRSGTCTHVGKNAALVITG